MNRILLMLLTFLALIFSTGCSISPKYQVSIDAVTAPNISLNPSTYDIKPLNNRLNSGDLLFQHHTTQLAQILHQKGYLRSSQGESVKQHIYFDYGLDQVDQQTETYREPDISFHVGWGGYPYARYYQPFFYPYYGGGYTTYRKTRNYYNRYVTLLAKDQFNKELWRVDVSSVGESKNLKKIIPLLIDAAKPYLGTNTSEPIQIVIKEKTKNK
ncbi:MAG: Unknown protein [uncultured Sulfurovum sp.]|uniref:DUF4136 domain-containing protein n=1 Tax=uncultured Sulfurovum sp. TaxID=269237 RepID=A0A6S6U059_9BACT|nr:MAG: Unknown protein [uncultured Sulfurovum sp.]